MREIKIQFILKDECIGNEVFGKLTYSLDEILEGITNEYICEKACESFSPANGVEADFEIIAKRQFTGLQDKNLEDIYEGDIIYHDDFNEPCKVTFERGCFRLYGFTIANFEAIHHLDTKVQVIGNIYENPELLESEK